MYIGDYTTVWIYDALILTSRSLCVQHFNENLNLIKVCLDFKYIFSECEIISFVLKVTYRPNGPGVYLYMYYCLLHCIVNMYTHVTIINNFLSYLICKSY